MIRDRDFRIPHSWDQVGRPMSGRVGSKVDLCRVDGRQWSGRLSGRVDCLARSSRVGSNKVDGRQWLGRPRSAIVGSTMVAGRRGSAVFFGRVGLGRLNFGQPFVDPSRFKCQH